MRLSDLMSGGMEKPHKKSRWERGVDQLNGPRKRGKRMTELVDAEIERESPVSKRSNKAEDLPAYAGSFVAADMNESDEAQMMFAEAKERHDAEAKKKKVGEKNKPRKKRKKNKRLKRWESLFFEVVPFDMTKLNPVARQAIQKKKRSIGYEVPGEMYQCKLSRFPHVCAQGHESFFLHTMKAGNMQRHFESFHSDCVEWMEKAVEEDCHRDRLLVQVEFYLRTVERASRTSSRKVLKERTMSSFFSGVSPVKIKEDLQKGGELLPKRHRQELSFLVWMIANELSFASLDGPEFERFKKEAVLKLRGRTKMTDLVRPIYQYAMKAQAQVLKECGFFSVTFDYWVGNGEDYLAITYHSCTPEFKLVHCVLDLVYTPGKKYAEHVQSQVQNCIDAHTDASCLLVSTVTDKGANVLAASRILTGEDAKFCINHEIKKVVDDCFCGSSATPATAPLAAALLTMITNISAWIRTDKDEKRVFESLQDQSVPLQLLVDNETRWEGKFNCIDRFLFVRVAINALLGSEQSLFQEMLPEFQEGELPFDFGGEQFWTCVKEVRDVLKVLHIVSKAAQGEEFITNSIIPYWVDQLMKVCVRDEGESHTVAQLKEALLRSIQSRMGYYLTEVNNSLKAAALDPRFALLSQFGIEDSVVEEVWDDIVEEQMNFCQISQEERPDKWERAKSNLKNNLTEIREILEASSKEYIDAGNRPGSGEDDELDPLHFWRTAVKGENPKVPSEDVSAFVSFAKSARMLLSIPAGSAPSERVFSVAGRVYSKLRTSLSDELLEMLVVCRDFICKSPIYSFDGLIAEIAQHIVNVEDVDQ